METLTREAIEAMPAGLDLDKHVALVLGYQPHEGYEGRWLTPDGRFSLAENGLPRFSTDVTDAWQVVEKMSALEDADEANAFWWNFWHGTAAQLRRLPAATVAAYICRACLIDRIPQPGLLESFAALAEHFKGVSFDMPASPVPSAPAVPAGG